MGSKGVRQLLQMVRTSRWPITATIVEEIHRHGDTTYTAEDPYNNRWIFAQARPAMSEHTTRT